MFAKKLLLINPAQEHKLNLVKVLHVQPTSLGYLAALTPSDWDIEIIDENVETLTFKDADLVGITAFTNNVPRAYEISEHYRRKGIKTVMGGIHASLLYEESKHYTDSVVIGEAESVWQRLLHDFESDELKRFYIGEHTSLENLVKPRRDLYSCRYKIGSVQTARGCPMDCEFCSVTTFHGRTYRERPVEEVLDELEAVNNKNIYFLDDTILGYGKKAEERAIQLFRGMKERGLNKRWFSQVGIDFANNSEVLKCAQKAGCVAVGIGLESIDEEALRGMHKSRNLKVGVRNYRELIKKIHEHGIGVAGSFLFGNDEDSKDIFERTTEFILDSKLDGAQFTILTPLPGTRLYNRLKQEGRLFYTNYPYDWKYYDFGEVVFKPKHMTPDELKEGVTQIYRHTTSRVTLLKKALDTLIQTRSLNLSRPVIGYLTNRAYGSLWIRKYEYVKNALPPEVNESYQYHPVADEESTKAEIGIAH